MTLPLFKRTYSCRLFRTSTPTVPTSFQVKALGPGEELEVTQLRMKFKITRDFSKHPNNCEVHLYNLAPNTRADFDIKPLSLQLNAGYDGINRLLFVGDVRFAMSKQDGTDWETMLQLGDGARTYANARVKKQYAAGTTYRQALTDCAKSMGLVLPPALAKDSQLDRPFNAGHVAYGPARDELDRLFSTFGYQWSIQNGVLRVLTDEQVVTPVEAVVISEEQGMIGSPEFGSPPKSGKPPHVRVKLLLWPELAPGDKIQLKSKAKSGFFKIIKVEHEGDTHGEPWFTTVEIKPL